jgi:transcriptional regulator with XRE-family HTH domain
MVIGDRIRAARERRGLTQSQLAEAVGVQPTAVTLWENKKNPRGITGPHLHKVAEVLEVSVAKLLGEPEQTLTMRPRMATIVVSPAEKTLLELFRAFPQELQLLQLAQFVECAKLRKVNHLGGQDAGYGLAEATAGDCQ